MSIDMFGTRKMISMLEQAKPVRTFLKDTFFNNETNFDTEVVDVDIVKGGRKVAAWVADRIGGKTVERTGYETKTYKPALVAPDMITTAENLMKRMAGEGITGTLTPDERAARQLGKDLAELDNMIARRIEVSCAQALTTGQVVMKGDGVNQTIGFGTLNGSTLSGTDLWNNAASNPVLHGKEFRREIAKLSGLSLNMCILGSDAAQAFLDNEKVQKLLNLRNVDIGMIKPAELPQGVVYLGSLDGMDYYEYNEWYYDEDAEDDLPLIPVNKAIYIPRGIRTDMLYGAVTIAEGEDLKTYAMNRVPNSWTQKKPAARYVQISSRPLPVLTQIDGVYVATVV